MLADLAALVTDLVRDDVDRVTPEQQARAITAAVAQYGKDRPRRVVEDVTAQGGSRLDIPAGALRVVAVELPAGMNPPRILSSGEWGHYHAPDEVYLMLRRPVATGTVARLTLLRLHELTDDTDTIPDTDREAVASYAAAVLFDQIAATTSGDGNPSIPADTVDHGAKPTNFAERGKTLRGRYYDLLGIDPKRVQAASAIATAPLPASDGGPRLTHYRRRWRG